MLEIRGSTTTTNMFDFPVITAQLFIPAFSSYMAKNMNSLGTTGLVY